MDISNIKGVAKISQVATRTFGKSLFVAKKYTPEILISVGVVGVVTSAVLASKATLRLEDVIDKTKDNLGKAHDLHVEEREDYTDQDYQKDVISIYTRSVLDVVKLYGPPVTLGLVSIGCIIGAHGIMRQRNVAVLGAYKALETSFAKYRKSVAEIIGEDKERDIRLGFREEVEEDEEGNAKTVTYVDNVGPHGYSQYARFFDETSPNWSRTSEYNLMFLRAAQNHANDLLHARGFVFLNEIYRELGIPMSQEGQLVGWTKKGNGDGYVDFGIYDFESDDRRAFVNGLEKSILLDFNVDGIIQDKI
jgi:hypothetical protein